MKTLTRPLAVLLLCVLSVTCASAEETIDTLLPPPGWLRRNADALNIDTETRESIERVYKEKEPTYHQLKYKVERLTNELYPQLVADKLDEELIVKRMKSLLKAENELKLYQVQVRISLLSQVSVAQRQAARKLAQQNPPPANWRGGVAAKVEKVRELSKQLVDRGESIKKTEKRMKEIDKAFADGKIDDGFRMLDQVISDLQQ